MVIGKEVKLPTEEQLTTNELNVSTATLMAAAPYIGKFCEGVNSEFMLCRQENNDPRPCVDLGKFVTACTAHVFQRIKSHCLQEFQQFAACVNLSSGRYEPWHCRKTQIVLDECMTHKLCLGSPPLGYFTRGRIHDGKCSKEPSPKECPCLPKKEDATPSLPDCKSRQPARFTSRLFWMTE